MDTEGTLVVTAPAKVNLGLAVTARRSDGFHEIETLFALLDLSDEITLRPAAGIGGRLLPAAPGLDLGDLRMDDGNLAMRAARAYLRAAGVRGAGVEVGLRKAIPVAAGLGGGSSDAAAVLTGLAALFPGLAESRRIAEDLGSDVPFFLSRCAGAWGTGRGERIEPVELPELHLVLVNPRIAVSAAFAYSRLESPGPGLDRGSLLEGLRGDDEPGYRNDLQPGVAAAYPVVAEALAALSHAGLRGVIMSGSGPTCLGLARDAEHARHVAEGLRERHPRWWIWSGRAAGTTAVPSGLPG